MTFDVSFDETDATKPKKPMPKRFQLRSAKKERPLTAQALAEKQQKADERRKALEADKIERIHEREEQCKKMAEAIYRMEAKQKAAEEAAKKKEEENGVPDGNNLQNKDNSLVNNKDVNNHTEDLSKLTRDLTISAKTRDLKICAGKGEYSH